MAIAVSVTSHWVASRLATNGASNAEGEVAVVAAAGDVVDEVAAGLAGLGVDLNGAVGEAVDAAEENGRVLSGGEGEGGADTALGSQATDEVS